jgi:hypothetical protein
MFGLIMSLMMHTECFELIKSKTNKNENLTVDQKIEILAWRTEVMAQAILEIDDKINYIINNCQYKNHTNVANLLGNYEQ